MVTLRFIEGEYVGHLHSDSKHLYNNLPLHFIVFSKYLIVSNGKVVDKCIYYIEQARRYFSAVIKLFLLYIVVLVLTLC